ncbi:lipase (class 2) domain-containing protein [Sarocladium implicatum]|nr:lipase (class 2) domain-containing protein [Sarocladium implicatum]
MLRTATLLAGLSAPLLTAGISWDLPSDLLEDPLYGAPDNDFKCKSDVHKNPVIMLHGLSANREVDLNTLSHHLVDDGWCVFSKTYGAHTLAPWIGGVKGMRDSAQEVADFITEVKEKTGADKVDLVGHSEGGVMALYVPMTQSGISDIVERNIALGPAIHGAQYFGFTDIFYIGGEVTRNLAALALKTLGCKACDDMAIGGDVYNDFKSASPIVQEGNKATIIMSTSDTLVAPDVSRVDEPGVRNVIVQDTCPDDKVGHAGLAWDKSVWGLIINALTEDYERIFECEKGLEI